MKKKCLISILALTLTLMCGISIGVNAAGTAQKITATLNPGITVKLDGQPQTFFDAKGSRVFPISYNGSTYLPVRAVAGLVGLDVQWDSPTQSVLLGKKTSGIDLIDTYKAYYLSKTYDLKATQVQSADKQTEDISGISCSKWIKLRVNGPMLDHDYICTASFNVLGKYSSLTFQYYANNDSTFKVLGDNNAVLFERNLSGGQVAQTVTVPLAKTNQLTFQFEKPKDSSVDTDLYIFNTQLTV